MRNFSFVRNIRLGIKSLMLHKLRSFLTMLGIVFGVSSVIAMLSIGEGASKEAMDRIRKLGSTNILISTVKPVEDEKVRKISHTTCARSGIEGAQDVAPPIRSKKTVRKDSVKQPASQAARSAPSRGSSPLIDKGMWNAYALRCLQDHQGDRVSALTAYLADATGDGVSSSEARAVFEIAAGRYEKLLALKH